MLKHGQSKKHAKQPFEEASLDKARMTLNGMIETAQAECAPVGGEKAQSAQYSARKSHCFWYVQHFLRKSTSQYFQSFLWHVERR